ncbi:MAG: ATP-grasp domain-containing protein [Rhodanobacteraceae bacterium]
MIPPHIALVTARAARGLDEDMPPLERALREAGAQVTIVDWDDDAIDWSRCDLALLRSTWDYTQRAAEFLDWAHRVTERARLLNPLAVVRWNIDKHYMADLSRAGVPVVPGAFVEPDDNAQAALTTFLDEYPGATEFVVKPCVGAGSLDAQRHRRDAWREALAHTQRLLDARRSALLQPYLHSVDEHGETALLFFDGEFSHAIRKGPMLGTGATTSGGLFVVEQITPREPSAHEIEIARRALAALPFPQPLLYARADLIRAEDGSPRLLELELTEPSVFLMHAHGAARRFAEAILRRVPA